MTRAVAGRVWAAVAVAVLSTSLVACSSHTPEPQPPSPTLGELSGRLVREGGPIDVPPVPLPGKVTVTGAGVSQELTVGKDGVFAFQLPAGRYNVVGHWVTDPILDRTMTCNGESTADVEPGRTISVDAVCLVS